MKFHRMTFNFIETFRTVSMLENHCTRTGQSSHVGCSQLQPTRDDCTVQVHGSLACYQSDTFLIWTKWTPNYKQFYKKTYILNT